MNFFLHYPIFRMVKYLCEFISIFTNILDGNTEKGDQVRRNNCYFIFLRHLIRSRAVSAKTYFPLCVFWVLISMPWFKGVLLYIFLYQIFKKAFFCSTMSLGSNIFSFLYTLTLILTWVRTGCGGGDQSWIFVSLPTVYRYGHIFERNNS